MSARVSISDSGCCRIDDAVCRVLIRVVLPLSVQASSQTSVLV